MSNDVALELLREVKEMRAELKEMRAAFLDDEHEEDTLLAYDHPDQILQALDDAKKVHGEPRHA